MRLLPIVVLLSMLNVGCAATLVSATDDAVKASEKLQCNPSLTVPGCITPAQFQQVNGVLNMLVTEETAYVSAGTTPTSIVAMAGGLVNAMTQIQMILEANATTLITDLKKALSKL